MVIPESMTGFCCISILAGIVSLLGIRLRLLSNENGHTSRMATRPQSRQKTHLGAFFKSSLARTTASISQLAVMLMLRILRNNAFMINLLS